MSHFSKIRTTLKDLTILKKALNDLSIVWDAEINQLKGYKNQSTFANIVIPQNNSYDVGFTWNGFEYQLVADLQFWQQPWSVELFLDKVTQRYAYHSILEATNKQGFKTIEEVSLEDDSIHLTLQRWSD
nr:photosystem I assembly protein Ycf35 [Chroomonas collegionis]